MKKIYIIPEMEILDAEVEGFLAASSLGEDITENGLIGTGQARQGGFDDFDDFEDFEEDEY
jgi:hypothetical protein